MGQYYQNIDRPGGFDYELIRLDGLKQVYRGPAIRMERPYGVCVGAAQTFGRFVEKPFHIVLSERLQLPILNLGVGGAGPRHFLRKEYFDIFNRAEFVITQVLSARSASNSLFDNSEGGGMIGFARTVQKNIRADEFYRSLPSYLADSQIHKIIDETRRDYMSSFEELLHSISAPRILFWVSTQMPLRNTPHSPMPHVGVFPHFVTSDMIEQLKQFADDYVECVCSHGLPQRLWRADSDIDGATLSNGFLWNRYYPSPEMHVASADCLESNCRRYTARANVTIRPNPRRFIIVGAPRTGTNLLIGLLNDYPLCFTGRELFNAQNIDGDIIPWEGLSVDQKSELLELRRSAPSTFLHRLFEIAQMKNYKAIGFKLLYSQGYSHRELLTQFANDKSLAIVHLKRRNLLRRHVSENQANLTGRWATSVGAQHSKAPAVELQLSEIISSIRRVEEAQIHYDELFKQHEKLDLFYEDLSAQPVRVTRRVSEFLGVADPSITPSIKQIKTGSDNLSISIQNYDDIRKQISALARFLKT